MGPPVRNVSGVDDEVRAELWENRGSEQSKVDVHHFSRLSGNVRIGYLDKGEHTGIIEISTNEYHHVQWEGEALREYGKTQKRHNRIQ